MGGKGESQLICSQHNLQTGSTSVSKTMIIMSGTIGAGKSTALNLLSSRFEIIPVQEPVESFSLLEGFYRDQERYAYPLQWECFVERAIRHWDVQQQPDHSNYVLERSVYEDRHCFAYNLYKSGVITEDLWKVYCKGFKALMQRLFVPPDMFIYLRISPDKALERMRKRMRDCEMQDQGPTLKYLISLHECYEEFSKKVMLKNIPLLILDGDRLDFEHVTEDADFVCNAFEQATQELGKSIKRKEGAIQQ